MKCPGQDRRYWTQDAVFEAPCPQCGANVEWFKDEGSGRCRKCGHRFLNPGADFGCAQWCALAQECVGFAPERQGNVGVGEGALAARLIQALKEHCADQQTRLAQAMAAFQHAKELVVKEGGDPRVVLAAALLLGSDGGAAFQGPSSHPDPEPRRILDQVGLDGPTTDRICQIVEACQQGRVVDAVEFRVAGDAAALAKLASSAPEVRAEELAGRLRTETARAKALALLGS
jgi:hypothetical protein